MQMNIQRLIIATALLGVLPPPPECCAAAKHSSKSDFIPAGKWEMSNGYSVCVPKGNRAPDPIRLAAEVASSGSTGDYRWVGECKILKYSAQAHAFSAKLSCSQASERSGTKTKDIFLASGFYKAPDLYKFTLQIAGQPADPDADTTTYRKISDTCSINPREIIVGPKTSIAKPLNPYLDVLTGLPEGTEANMP